MAGANVVVLDNKDVFQRFPKLQMVMRDSDKEELASYIREKVRNTNTFHGPEINNRSSIRQQNVNIQRSGGGGGSKNNFFKMNLFW